MKILMQPCNLGQIVILPHAFSKVDVRLKWIMTMISDTVHGLLVEHVLYKQKVPGSVLGTTGKGLIVLLCLSPIRDITGKVDYTELAGPVV